VNVNHPIYFVIKKLLGENSKIFKDYIKLLSESIPVGMIISDFSEPSVVMKDFFENEESELKVIYENMTKALIENGFSESEAKTKVSLIKNSGK
jgi:hypothetical protein